MFVAIVGAPVYVVSFSIFRTVVMRDAFVALWRTRFATIQVHIRIVLDGRIVFVCGVVIGVVIDTQNLEGLPLSETFFSWALYIEPVEEGAFSFS